MARISGSCGIFPPTLSVSFLEKETGSLILVFPNGAQPPFQLILSGMSVQASFSTQQAGSG